MLLQRRRLFHTAPDWVATGSSFFITIGTATRGVNHLCHPVLGKGIIDSALYYQQIGRWWLRIFLLMPDHLHAVLAVPSQEGLASVFKAWKAYQARYAKIEWQAGFFDHRLRTYESAAAKIKYIRQNPVRARLVNRPEDWPYVWPRIEDDLAEGGVAV